MIEQLKYSLKLKDREEYESMLSHEISNEKILFCYDLIDNLVCVKFFI